jgi:hypothetical protein
MDTNFPDYYFEFSLTPSTVLQFMPNLISFLMQQDMISKPVKLFTKHLQDINTVYQNNNPNHCLYTDLLNAYVTLDESMYKDLVTTYNDTSILLEKPKKAYISKYKCLCGNKHKLRFYSQIISNSLSICISRPYVKKFYNKIRASICVHNDIDASAIDEFHIINNIPFKHLYLFSYEDCARQKVSLPRDIDVHLTLRV